MNIIIQIIGILLGLVIGYIVSYLAEKGKLKAQSEIIGSIINEMEVVKQKFNESNENLKGLISKQNIEFQIHYAELTKKRFDKIENMYKDIYNLSHFILDEFILINDEELFKEKIHDFHVLFNTANKQCSLTSLYISDDLYDNIRNILNESYVSYKSFKNMFLNVFALIESGKDQVIGSNSVHTAENQIEKQQTLLYNLTSSGEKLVQLLPTLREQLKSEIFLIN